MTKLPIALQLYSVRDEAEQDLRGTLQKIADMGYDGVEFAGLYGHTPEQVRDMVKELGLTPIAAHIGFDELTSDTEGTVDKYITIGCRYMIIPNLAEKDRPVVGDFDRTIEAIKAIGEVCNRKGVTLLYHNHSFEFVRMPDGEYGLDYLYKAVSAELLQTEIDPCWVRVGGADPVPYIRKYAGRCPIVQLKDFIGGSEGGETADQTFSFRAVGYGVLDTPGVVKAAIESGATWLVVEQDFHEVETAMEDARLSLEYVRAL